MKINLILAGCLILGMGTMNGVRILFVRNNTEGSVVIAGKTPTERVIIPAGQTVHDVYLPGEAFVEYGKPSARLKAYLADTSFLGIEVDTLGLHLGLVR